MNWQAKALDATKGSLLGAVLRCAMKVERDALPRFEGQATLTSDGFLMCDFVDAEDMVHFGAFVGANKDYQDNLRKLAAHCKLTGEETGELIRAGQKFLSWS